MNDVNNLKAKVYLVGAGPGDMELVTVKAIRLIREADVILYDKLINKELLTYRNADCELVYVGKEDNRHIVPQETINEMLYNFSQVKKKIVRLKGGDPFIFGRGGEEAIYLYEKGIEFEIVPGISSSYSAAAYAGIPVTQRGVASNFAVITGHEDPSKQTSSIHWEGIVGINTLVFLMSVHTRMKIAENLIRVGRDKNQAVAFVRNGTRQDQQVTITTLQGILDGNADQVKSPAIMIIGEVVNLREKLKWHFTDNNNLPDEPFDLTDYDADNVENILTKLA